MAGEDFPREEDSKQGYHAKMEALTCNDSIMLRAAGHTLQSCFSPETPALPDSPTDSHMSMDPPTTFTEQEDEFLRELVKRHGTKKWHIISAKMHNKTPRECRKRWRTYLHMCMNKSSWSEEEDRLLIEGHNAYGNRWTEIAKMVPGSSEMQEIQIPQGMGKWTWMK
ncbi:hypothetical protein Mapa_017830 [Marchantia paleacea]|nr:hypothetical protein Mapa_017830 [Marchantia paleacea]